MLLLFLAFSHRNVPFVFVVGCGGNDRVYVEYPRKHLLFASCFFLLLTFVSSDTSLSSSSWARGFLSGRPAFSALRFWLPHLSHSLLFSHLLLQISWQMVFCSSWFDAYFLFLFSVPHLADFACFKGARIRPSVWFSFFFLSLSLLSPSTLFLFGMARLSKAS